MYDEICKLPLAKRCLMLGLEPMTPGSVASAKGGFPNCPESYWSFLMEIGAGKIKEPDEPENFPAHFAFLKRLLSAEKEYYFDRRIYEGGAKGDIMIFGVDSAGIAFGFDTGDGWRIVEVDNYGIVNKLSLPFEAFVLGVFVCYPDIPVSYADGKWKAATGEEYSLPS